MSDFSYVPARPILPMKEAMGFFSTHNDTADYGTLETFLGVDETRAFMTVLKDQSIGYILEGCTTDDIEEMHKHIHWMDTNRLMDVASILNDATTISLDNPDPYTHGPEHRTLFGLLKDMNAFQHFDVGGWLRNQIQARDLRIIEQDLKSSKTAFYVYRLEAIPAPILP